MSCYALNILQTHVVISQTIQTAIKMLCIKTYLDLKLIKSYKLQRLKFKTFEIIS